MPTAIPKVSEPLQIEFVDAQDVPAQQRPETPLASHQNQNAQDLNDSNLPEGAVPFSEGVSQNKEAFETTMESPQASTGSQEQLPTDPASAKTEEHIAEEGFDFAEVLKQDPKRAQRAQERAVFGPMGAPKEAVAYENSQSSALDRGGLQLSTYAWDYAPYMAYLKRHIDRHIFPPRAFDLGLIDGTTRVKFRIYKDGRLEGPFLLDYKGSDMLKNTSLKAIELSAPFRDLPQDFPDEFLEIVGTFEFIILRGPQNR